MSEPNVEYCPSQRHPRRAGAEKLDVLQQLIVHHAPSVDNLPDLSEFCPDGGAIVWRIGPQPRESGILVADNIRWAPHLKPPHCAYLVGIRSGARDIGARHGDLVVINPEHGKHMSDLTLGDIQLGGDALLFGAAPMLSQRESRCPSPRERAVRVPLDVAMLAVVDGEELRALGRNVILMASDVADQSEGGIYLTENSRKGHCTGTVLSAGPECADIHEDLVPGSEVLYIAQSVVPILTNKGKRYRVVSADAIMAVVS